MAIGVIVLVVAFIYNIVFGIILARKDKPQTGVSSSRKDREEQEKRTFIIGAIGVALFFVAYMMIIPTPKPGKDRWFNSVLFLRLFWKTFGSLFATAGSFLLTIGIISGLGSLFTKKKKPNWKSLNKEEAMQAFNETYANEFQKLRIATASVTNPHEGYYGRFNTKMEQIAKTAPLAEIRIEAVKKLRNKNQLDACLIYERDENVRKAIEARIANLANPFL